MSITHQRKIRALLERRVEKRNERRRAKCKPGNVHLFSRGVYRGSVQNAAPWLPSSPVVDGVRMRYEKGRLVPRMRA